MISTFSYFSVIILNIAGMKAVETITWRKNNKTTNILTWWRTFTTWIVLYIMLLFKSSLHEFTHETVKSGAINEHAWWFALCLLWYAFLVMITLLINLRDSSEYTTPKSTSKYRYRQIVLDKNITRHYNSTQAHICQVLFIPYS